DKAVVHLISLRFSDRSGGPPLWPTAHPLGGETTEIPGIQHGVDVLASRYAMQTLLGAYLMSGERAYGVALDQAHQAVGKLPRDRDGLWDRLYAPKTLRPLATTRQSGLAEMFTPPAVVDAWRE